MIVVDMDNCGMLFDFGNFWVSVEVIYDWYMGVEEFMLFVKVVSVKSYEFNDDGDEVCIDYWKMMFIVKEVGYEGWVGIEYEGGGFSEFDGIKVIKKFLEVVCDELGWLNFVVGFSFNL